MKSARPDDRLEGRACSLPVPLKPIPTQISLRRLKHVRDDAVLFDTVLDCRFGLVTGER